VIGAVATLALKWTMSGTVRGMLREGPRWVRMKKGSWKRLWPRR